MSLRASAMPCGPYARTRDPCASRLGTITRLGASSMSSVLGLKVRPSTAMILPSSEPPLRQHLGGHCALAAIVHRHHHRHDAARHDVALTDRGERGEILGKARASKTGSRVQELRCNAAVESHSACDLLHVSATLFAKVSHFIDRSEELV